MDSNGIEEDDYIQVIKTDKNKFSYVLDKENDYFLIKKKFDISLTLKIKSGLSSIFFWMLLQNKLFILGLEFLIIPETSKNSFAFNAEKWKILSFSGFLKRGL